MTDPASNGFPDFPGFPGIYWPTDRHQTRPNRIRPDHTGSNRITPDQTKSDRIKPDQTGSYRIIPYQTESNRIRPDQTRSQKTMIFNRVLSDICVLDCQKCDFRPRLKRYLCVGCKKPWFSTASEAIFVLWIPKASIVDRVSTDTCVF